MREDFTQTGLSVLQRTFSNGSMGLFGFVNEKNEISRLHTSLLPGPTLRVGSEQPLRREHKDAVSTLQCLA